MLRYSPRLKTYAICPHYECGRIAIPVHQLISPSMCRADVRKAHTYGMCMVDGEVCGVHLADGDTSNEDGGLWYAAVSEVIFYTKRFR